MINLWEQIGSYEAPGIVGSGLYDITIVCGPKYMSVEKYVLISQKYKHPGWYYEFLYRVDGSVYLL